MAKSANEKARPAKREKRKVKRLEWVDLRKVNRASRVIVQQIRVIARELKLPPKRVLQRIASSVR